MIHVIFICTGNVCRSAMAEGYLKSKIEQADLEEKILVESAGLNAIPGQEVTDYAIKVMAKYEVNISAYRAKLVEKTKLEKADYIIAMTNEQKQELILNNPELKDKIHLLKEYGFNGTYMDIDDPWGLSLETYETCATEIVNSVDSFMKKIEQENNWGV